MGENHLPHLSSSNLSQSFLIRPPEASHIRKPSEFTNVDNDGFILVQSKQQKRKKAKKSQELLSGFYRDTIKGRDDQFMINNSTKNDQSLPPMKKPIAISLNREQGRKSWADIVADQPQEPNDKNCNLEHIAPIKINNKKYDLVKEEVCKRATETWNNSVLVYVVGTKPYYMFFKSYIQRVCKPIGDFEVFTRENGFFLVKFKDSLDALQY